MVLNALRKFCTNLHFLYEQTYENGGKSGRDTDDVCLMVNATLVALHSTPVNRALTI